LNNLSGAESDYKEHINMATNFKPATLVHPVTGDRVAVKSEDEANRFFASNYKLEKTPPTPASIERVTSTATPNLSYEDIGKISPSSKIKDYIKQGIQMKQGMNKDIQAGKDRWRTFQRDTSPFADTAFREMSPSDQASIRASKDAAASAHLQGLREEEEYRGTRLSDTLGAITDAQKEQRASKTQDLQDALLRLELTKTAKDSGYNYDSETGLSKDYSSATAKSIANAIRKAEGGLNYDYSNPDRAEQGAFQFMPETWNQYAREFAGEVLHQSVETLPMTTDYQNAVVEYKIQKWLDAEYTPQQIAAAWNAGEDTLEYNPGWWKNARGTSTITGEEYDIPAYIDRFTKALDKEAPQRVSSEEQIIIDATGLSIEQLASLNEQELDSLLKTTIKDMESGLTDEYESVDKEAATIEVDSFIKEEDAKNTDPEIIMASIIRKYGNKLSTAELESAMKINGFKKVDGYTWSKNYK